MIAYVTVITQQESSWVSCLPTGLTHCALKTSPTFAENHFTDLEKRNLFSLETICLTQYSAYIITMLEHTHTHKRSRLEVLVALLRKGDGTVMLEQQLPYAPEVRTICFHTTDAAKG